MDRIKSLPPSKRKHYRIQAPLRVAIDGSDYETADWSSGGFRIEGYEGGKPDSIFTVTLSIPFQGYWVTTETKVKLVRFEQEKGELAVQFHELEERTKELLDYFARGLLSGEMSAVDGAIRRIDTPVTPMETKVERDPRELGWGFQAKRWTRYAMYLLIGMSLTWYVGSNLYAKVWRLQVSTATLTAPMEELLSPTDGWIEELFVEEGQWVKKGDELFRMIDKEAAANEQEARRRVEEAEMAYRQALSLRDVEEEKIELYRDVLDAKMAASASRLTILQEQANLLKRHYDRTASLYQSGDVSVRELEVSESAYNTLLAEIETVKSQTSVDSANLAALENGFLIESGRFQANLPEREAELELAKARFALEQDALKRQHQENTVVVKAPFDGRIADIPKSEGTSIRQGGEVLLLEESNARRVEAWLSPEQARFVRLHDPATVELKALGFVFRGTVIEIDSRSVNSEDFSILGNTPGLRVVIKLVDLAEGNFRQDVTFEQAMEELAATDSVGMLANVSFRRDW